MRHCEFCATELADNTTFCWHCGRAAIGIAENPTLPHAQPVAENQATASAGTGEEEKRRRAATPGLDLSLPGKAVTQAPGNDIAAVQGTPQFKGVPSVQDAPKIAQTPHMPPIPKWQIPRLPTYPSIPAVHHAAPAQPTVQHGTLSPPTQPAHPLPALHGPGARQSGCVPALIVAGTTCLLIVASIIGAGFTILSPSLSLSGSTDVAWGESIHLHGSNFIPGSSVVLTLDGTTPLYFTSRNPAIQVSYSTITMAGLETIEDQFAQISSVKNNVVVSGNGTFNVSVSVSPNWHAGHHFIRAAEEISPRRAELTFTIQQPGTSSTTSPSPTETPAPPLGLSCVKPASLSLTASTGYTQPVSQKVTLCTTGSGTINWTASWDHNAASWLQLDRTSGKINAPGQEQVTVSTLAANLRPGKYTTTITFSNQASSSQVPLTVSFTIYTGCVNVTPETYKVSSAISATQTQTATVINCGNAVGSWVASTSANWLKVIPAGGTLSAGAAQKVTITMSQVKVGAYTGQSIFTLGESQFVVHVTLQVQAPTLSVKPDKLNAYQDCHQGQMGWVCNVTVTNNGDVAANLNWSASNSGSTHIIFIPASGTLAAGKSVPIVVDIPYSDCGDILTFAGPANSAPVIWTGICG